MSVSSRQFHRIAFKYLSYHLSNCRRQRFRIAIVSKSAGLGPMKARVLYPFVLTCRYCSNCTIFSQEQKKAQWAGSHSAASFALSIFCSSSLQDHRYITMRSFGSITSSCHTEPGFPHTLFNTHNTSG